MTGTFANLSVYSASEINSAPLQTGGNVVCAIRHGRKYAFVEFTNRVSIGETCLRIRIVIFGAGIWKNNLRAGENTGGPLRASRLLFKREQMDISAPPTEITQAFNAPS